jgi:hypothetical protein
MKNAILILLAVLMALPAFSQRLEYWTDGPDTSLTTTVYNTDGIEIKRAFNYDARIYVNVTGTEAATVKVECKPVGGATYFPLKTWTGISADGYYSHSGYVLGGTLRVSALSTNSGNVAITSWVSINPQNPKANRVLDYWTDGPDTSTTTAVTLAGGSTFKHDTYYDMAILVDVVSDTATLYVDVLPFGSAVWIPIDTVASIMADTYYLYQSSTVGGKVRARCLSTGAGSTGCTVWTQYARKEDD